MERGSNRVALALAGGYLLGLVLLVFTPLGWTLNRLTVRLYTFWHYTAHLPGTRRPLPEDFGFALNVVLFVPLGVIVVLLLSRSWWVTALIAAATSFLIEAVQLLGILGRETTVSDLISNTLGGLVGAIGALAWRARNHSSTARGRSAGKRAGRRRA